MNDFTTYELQSLLWALNYVRDRTNNCGDTMRSLKIKIQSMIDNYCEPDGIKTIGTGQLLFHNKDSESALVPKIIKQLDLCENSDKTKCFRIDWKILFGKKTGQ